MGRKSGITLKERLTIDELSVLNHELGNVLNGLSGMAGLLRDSGLTAEQGRWLEAIEQSGRQMCRIMESTFDYQDGTEPRTRVRSRWMSGVKMLEGVMISHAPLALSKGLDFVLVMDPKLPSCWYSDCGLLRQLLDNLVGNALKFTASGYVGLRAAVQEDVDLVLSVCDSGPGIRQPALMFEPGQRGDAAGADQPGCGLGLFVCRRIVESMGGSLSVHREPGGGSRFDARIPSVVDVQSGDARGIPSLGSLVCRLELDQRLKESVQSFLERLGVGWKGNDKQFHGPEHDGEFRIEQIKAGAAMSGLRISGSTPGSCTREVFVAPPVLESSLEQALFQLLLHQRLERVNPSEMPG